VLLPSPVAPLLPELLDAPEDPELWCAPDELEPLGEPELEWLPLLLPVP
jgi:hypothetical protein